MALSAKGEHESETFSQSGVVLCRVSLCACSYYVAPEVVLAGKLAKSAGMHRVYTCFCVLHAPLQRQACTLSASGHPPYAPCRHT